MNSRRWALAAGILLAAAFVTETLVPNFVFAVPLLVALEATRREPGYRQARLGFLFGATAHLITLHFMVAMLDFSWLAALLYAGMALALGLKTAIVCQLVGVLRRRSGWSFAVLLPAVWVPFDWLLSFGDLRMTADHMVQTLGAYPFLVQFVDLTGPYGASLLLLAAGGLLYEGWFALHRHVRRRSWWILAGIAVAVLAYDAWAWTRTSGALATGPTVRTAVVQPDIPLRVKRGLKTEQQQREVLERLTLRAAEDGAELIVWPETARPRTLYRLPGTDGLPPMRDEQRLARSTGAALLVGTEYVEVTEEEPFRFYNAAMLVHPDGRIDDAWGGKVYLVPFTEQLPYRMLFGPLLEGRGGEWEWLAGGFTPSPQNALLPLDGDRRIGVLVCYEHFFPDLPRALRNRGARLQAVISNDAWFGRTYFQRFQIQSLRLRAIENRTAFARAGNSGPSGFVDPLGRWLDGTPLYEEALRVRDLPLASGPTFYGRAGDWPVWIAVAALAAAGLRRRVGALG